MILRTAEQVKDWLRPRAHKDFAFDVETTGTAFRKDRLLGLALSVNEETAYIPFMHTVEVSEGVWEVKDIVPIEDVLFPLQWFFSQDVEMLAHNAKFDMHFLNRGSVDVRGRLVDTLLAAQLLDENRSNGLKDLAPLTGMAMDKYTSMVTIPGYGKHEFLGVELERGAAYAELDVLATERLWKLFKRQLTNEVLATGRSLYDVFRELWMPLLPVLREMESRGIALDIERVHAVRQDLIQKTETLHNKIVQEGIDWLEWQYTPATIPELYLKSIPKEDTHLIVEDNDGIPVYIKDGIVRPVATFEDRGKTRTYRPRAYDFNPGSPDQLREFLHNKNVEKMWAEVPATYTKSGKVAMDKSALEMAIFYGGDHAPAYVRDILNWKKATKFIGTYLDRFIEDADPIDNSITTNFKQDGARTGRLSSTEPNLMNISSRGDFGKIARNMFISRPGHVLLVADLSQAELRMVAHFSGDEYLTKAFLEDLDLHSMTAAGIRNIAYEDFLDQYKNGDPDAKKYRNVGKTMNFGMLYGMGAKKLQRTLVVEHGINWTVTECKYLIEATNSTYQGMTDYKREVESRVYNDGYVLTLYGRKRRLPDARSKDRDKAAYARRQGFNAEIQGSVGDIMCEGMVAVQPHLKDLGGSLLLQIHDENVAEVPEDAALVGKYVMERHMVENCNKVLRVPQSASAGVGRTWGSAKD